jgi:undecaprenyl-diphosphatase
MSTPGTPGTTAPAEDLFLLAKPRPAARVTLVLAAATVVLLLMLAVPASMRAVQRVDDSVLSFMLTIRWSPLTSVAKAMDVVGRAYVTWPVRILLLAYLLIRRRWWFVLTVALAVVTSEASISLLKVAYGRPRPLDTHGHLLSLVHISGASFPSGHAVATATTALLLAMVLFPPGPKRRGWEVAMVALTLIMGASRAYLAAHWLSDAVGGVLIGATLTLGSATFVQWLRARSLRRAAERGVRGEIQAEAAAEPGPLESAGVPEEAGRPGRREGPAEELHRRSEESG